MQIKQIRALDLRDFEQICVIYFPSLREQVSKVAYATHPFKKVAYATHPFKKVAYATHPFKKVAYATHPRPLVLAVGGRVVTCE